MIETIKARLFEIETANADLERASVIMHLMLDGAGDTGDAITAADKADSFRLIADVLRSIYDRIDEAREAAEDELRGLQRESV